VPKTELKHQQNFNENPDFLYRLELFKSLLKKYRTNLQRFQSENEAAQQNPAGNNSTIIASPAVVI